MLLTHPKAAIGYAFSLLVATMLAACGPAAGSRTGDRVELEYWEKWTGFEREAMARVVDAFNQSQDRIHVRFLLSLIHI